MRDHWKRSFDFSRTLWIGGWLNRQWAHRMELRMSEARGMISGLYKFYSKAASTMEFLDTFSLFHLHIVDSLTSVSNLVCRSLKCPA